MSQNRPRSGMVWDGLGDYQIGHCRPRRSWRPEHLRPSRPIITITDACPAAWSAELGVSLAVLTNAMPLGGGQSG